MRVRKGMLCMSMATSAVLTKILVQWMGRMVPRLGKMVPTMLAKMAKTAMKLGAIAAGAGDG